jgi:hypothetical protein
MHFDSFDEILACFEDNLWGKILLELLDSIWHKSVGFCEKLPSILSNIYYTERPKLFIFVKSASE